MHDKAPLEGNELEYLGSIDTPEEEELIDWVAMARSAWESSTDYLNANHRHQLEKNIANFQNRHPAGSKYYNDSYKTRSKLFRPKVRTAERKNEAAIAAALFGAKDLAVFEAEDADDPRKRQDAAYWHEVVNYRLAKTIPWFQIVMGASQDAQVNGIVISKQDWEYEKVPTGEDKMVPHPMYPHLPDMDINGNPIFRPEMDVIKDRPRVRIIRIENFRFDPRCDWLDPVNSSPYLIECIPMYVGDVLARMEAIDAKTGMPKWMPLTRAEIVAFGKDSDQEDDTTSKVREQGKALQADHDVSDFETVMVHENIIRYDGQDWVYYTLSTRWLLSEPEPLEEVYHHDIRPYVIGKIVIETHKAIPASIVELGEGLQSEANDTANLRIDNIKLALLKRYIAERGKNTDFKAMIRGATGGITLTDDIDSIKPLEFHDVTSSAYAEQNRIDADMDDILGVFSTGSVQTNRQLNETVGGMEMMSQSANQVTEYNIRTLVETWVEPVLRQLVLLEQHYEDDEHIKSLALKAVEKQEKKVAQKTGQPTPPIREGEAALLPIEEPQNVDVRVNVGFGNLNPDQRLKKIMTAMNVVLKVMPHLVQKIDPEEFVDEIFGVLGHKHGARFFTDLEMPKQQPNPEIELEKMKLQLHAKIEQAKLASNRQIKASELSMKYKITMEQAYLKLGFDRERMMQDKEMAAAANLTTLAGVEQKDRELSFKAQTGRQGI